MDDWDLFSQIRPPTPPPAKPRRTRIVKEEESTTATATTTADMKTETSMASVENDDSNEAMDHVDVDVVSNQEVDDDELADTASCSTTCDDVPSNPDAFYCVRPRPATIVINGRVQRIIDDRPSTKCLDQLPPEVLEQVFRRLDGEGMSNLALCSKRLFDVSLTDCIWSERIEREFGLKPESYR